VSLKWKSYLFSSSDNGNVSAIFRIAYSTYSIHAGNTQSTGPLAVPLNGSQNLLQLWFAGLSASSSRSFIYSHP